MRKLLRALLLAAVASLMGGCAGIQAAEDADARPLLIEVEPVLADGSLHLRVDVTFDGDASGNTLLLLPGQWAGESQLYRAVRALHPVSPGATLADTDRPELKKLKHAPAQPVHFQYELWQDFDGPAVTKGKYRPLLQADYFHLIGFTAWVLPLWDDKGEDRFKVTLRWKSVPANWSLANSFGVRQSSQQFSALREQLQSAIYVGGDFRLNRADINGQPVYTAVRGNWSFSDAQFTQTVRNIVAAERSFWQAGEPYFLVTAVPLADPPPSSSVGGTGLTASFATFLTPNVTQAQLEYLVTHEYFHNWNPRKLGRSPQPEAAMYWVSEGFTDYYTHVLRLRAGLLTLDGFVAQINDVLKQAYTSPLREADNARIARDFWTNRYVERLPYQRGTLMALQWNAQIRQASGGGQSFDNVMFDLAASARSATGELQALTPQRVNNALQSHTGTDETPAIERHITQGELPAPNPLWLGPHARLAWQQQPVFELGFDRVRLASDKVIAGVDPRSAAYRAGLRDGQQTAGYSIYGDDVMHPVVIKLREGASVREISYLPHAAQGVQVPQLSLPPDMTPEQRAQTLRWLGAPPL